MSISNPKDATRKLLELINECGKVAGHKINAWKSLAFLYTNDEKSEREIKETLSLTTATKRRDEEWPPLATTRESPRTETKTQHSQK